MNVDLLLCHSKKSKFIDEQCLHKRKSGEFFCGIHLKSIKKVIYTPIVEMGILTTTGTVPQPISPKYDEVLVVESDESDGEEIVKLMDSIVGLKENKDKKIYNNRDEFFMDLFEKQKCMSVFTLRQSIYHLGLTKYVGSTKKSRPKLMEGLSAVYEMERKYHRDLSKIIKMQGFIRKVITKEYYLKKCRNDTDIISFDEIWDIPRDHLYIYWDREVSKRDGTNVYYAYDIRTIHHIMKTDNPSCPYTCREFSVIERTRFVNLLHSYIGKGVALELEELTFSKEEKTEMRMRDLFHQINLLDNYTSFEWFKNLSANHLYEFYRVGEDIWNYRLQMPGIEKRKYVQNGIAFTTSKNIVRHMNMDDLRNCCLNEIERFITNGIGRDERKLGAMWMLTALVEVSPEAATALPHLVQLED
jgi:hypothetical protein